MRHRRSSSIPWRRVLPTFWKYPALTAPLPALTNWMSSADPCGRGPPGRSPWRRCCRGCPLRTSWRDTGCSGGSATKIFGSVQGASGSAHVSSTGEGTRIPWLTPPKTLRRSLAQVSAGRGVEPAIGVRGVDRGRLPRPILRRYPGRIEAAGQCHAPPAIQRRSYRRRRHPRGGSSRDATFRARRRRCLRFRDHGRTSPAARSARSRWCRHRRRRRRRSDGSLPPMSVARSPAAMRPRTRWSPPRAG